MKRIGNLWPQIISLENLHRAAYQVLRGKRDQSAAGDFFRDLEGNLLRLQDELLSGSYVPGGYRTFWISDPKRRLISAAPFKDRVVHHALVNVIEPVFERRFIHHSYACRTGKGTHRALTQFVRWARESRYVLKMDIRKFFPSIDHEILKDRIRRTIKDPEVLRLSDLIVDGSNAQEPVTGYFPGDGLLTPLERRRGIPIGNLTSQFFANVYLDALDHFVKDRLGMTRYLRYVDDFCCCHDSKDYLTGLRERISEFLFMLRLRLNEGKSRVRQVKEGVEFLGFVVLPDRLRLNQTGVRRQRRRLKKLQKDYAAGLIGSGDVKASVQAWVAHAEHGDTCRLRNDVLGSARFKRSRKESIGF